MKDNVLPQEATAVINFRIHPKDSIAAVIAHVDCLSVDGQIVLEITVDNDSMAILSKGGGRRQSRNGSGKQKLFHRVSLTDLKPHAGAARLTDCVRYPEQLFT